MRVADLDLSSSSCISLLESLTAGCLAGNGGVLCFRQRNNYIRSVMEIMGGFHPNDKMRCRHPRRNCLNQLWFGN